MLFVKTNESNEIGMSVVNGHWSCNLWCFSFALVIYESTAIIVVNKVIDVAIQGLSNPPSQGDKVSRLF